MRGNLFFRFLVCDTVLLFLCQDILVPFPACDSIHLFLLHESQKKNSNFFMTVSSGLPNWPMPLNILWITITPKSNQLFHCNVGGFGGLIFN